MIWALRAIFGAVVCGDFLLAGVIWLLLERRERRENKALAHFPPDEKPDETKQAREAREEAEAWRQMMNYSAEDAYGMGNSG